MILLTRVIVSMTIVCCGQVAEDTKCGTDALADDPECIRERGPNSTIGLFTAAGFGGRGHTARKSLVAEHGGTAESEAAVDRALSWLAAVQLPDGGWSFDHRAGPPNPARKAPDPGNLEVARNAATAMAVLPFLGAGCTHVDGPYRDTVERALAYLTANITEDGSLREQGGTMYSHALAAIALGEAYGMTEDGQLRAPAQAALNFIADAQDPVGGGWRYTRRQPGDMSVSGWQLMALKTGHMASLQVPPNTIAKAVEFLDSVSTENGAFYGYTSPAKRSSLTAVGLLCRMHLGWTQDHESLNAGVQYLADLGPRPRDMYYNFHVTRLMRQIGGEHWTNWNAQMRDHLVQIQVKEGPGKGSWHVGVEHAGWAPDLEGIVNRRGGRLGNTALATMILQAYYRDLPIRR